MDQVTNIEERPEDAARRFARRLVAIEEAHSPRQREHFGFMERWCRECRQDWPCPTVKVARGDDDDEMADAPLVVGDPF